MQHLSSSKALPFFAVLQAAAAAAGVSSSQSMRQMWTAVPPRWPESPRYFGLAWNLPQQLARITSGLRRGCRSALWQLPWRRRRRRRGALLGFSFHRLSLTFHCLSLTVHRLSLTFPLPLADLST